MMVCACTAQQVLSLPDHAALTCKLKALPASTINPPRSIDTRLQDTQDCHWEFLKLINVPESCFFRVSFLGTAWHAAARLVRHFLAGPPGKT